MISCILSMNLSGEGSLHPAVYVLSISLHWFWINHYKRNWHKFIQSTLNWIQASYTGLRVILTRYLCLNQKEWWSLRSWGGHLRQGNNFELHGERSSCFPGGWCQIHILLRNLWFWRCLQHWRWLQLVRIPVMPVMPASMQPNCILWLSGATILCGGSRLSRFVLIKSSVMWECRVTYWVVSKVAWDGNLTKKPLSAQPLGLSPRQLIQSDVHPTKLVNWSENGLLSLTAWLWSNPGVLILGRLFVVQRNTTSCNMYERWPFFILFLHQKRPQVRQVCVWSHVFILHFKSW